MRCHSKWESLWLQSFEYRKKNTHLNLRFFTMSVKYKLRDQSSKNFVSEAFLTPNLFKFVRLHLLKHFSKKYIRTFFWEKHDIFLRRQFLTVRITGKITGNVKNGDSLQRNVFLRKSNFVLPKIWKKVHCSQSDCRIKKPRILSIHMLYVLLMLLAKPEGLLLSIFCSIYN